MNGAGWGAAMAACSGAPIVLQFFIPLTKKPEEEQGPQGGPKKIQQKLLFKMGF
jgi:hypothetical protein